MSTVLSRLARSSKTIGASIIIAGSSQPTNTALHKTMTHTQLFTLPINIYDPSWKEQVGT